MYYNGIPDDAAGRRTAERLLLLRKQFADEVPAKCFDKLLLATWNIRDFDSAGYGDRIPEAMYYIAEIISHFDLVAIQEVREDLEALDRVKSILGDWWRYIATDVTEGKQGNRERMAFLYDTRKVRFGGVAGEVVIQPVEKTVKVGGKKKKKKKYEPAKQLYRTPFICAFKAGWSRFMLCTVHILYGKETADDPDRVEEIRLLAKFGAARAGSKSAWSSNIIALGDFNIFGRDDVTYKAITDAGFVIPEELQTVPATNLGAKKRHYDPIAFVPKPQMLETTGKAGCSTSTKRC